MRSVKPSELSKSATAAALANLAVRSHPRSLEARGAQTWAELQQQKKKTKRARLVGVLIAIAVALVTVGVVVVGAALQRSR